MRQKSLTVAGKTDGFGCQLNAKLSGIAFCWNNPRYRYRHTPFKSVSHGWRSKEAVEKINSSFMHIPWFQRKGPIHVRHKWMKKVFNKPNEYYVHNVLDHLRRMYWHEKEYVSLEQITVHIRRGDIQPHRRDGGRWLRHQKNNWYNKIIPKISNLYPDHYPIVIHSEGKMEEFESIIKNWPSDLVDRTIFKLPNAQDFLPAHKTKNNMLEAFHEMVSSKVFVQSKSGLSYTAGIFSEGENYFHRGNRAAGQRIPLKGWNIVQDVV